jgi:hypothetical protein
VLGFALLLNLSGFRKLLIRSTQPTALSKVGWVEVRNPTLLGNARQANRELPLFLRMSTHGVGFRFAIEFIGFFKTIDSLNPTYSLIKSRLG